ncbi:MAG: Asp-tRNA(Asn)/Glu-tRNA(Gln) amidotransferase subunit GatC [Patescibacteria group bacterium]
MSEINKKSLEHLAGLARIELKKGEEEKFLTDLKNILNHFQELQALNTENVQPLTGGTEQKNVMREDAVFEENHFEKAEKITGQFPDEEKGYLKIPPVFE